MSDVNWRAILGWNDEQLEELRFSGFSFLREGHYTKALLFFKALVVLNPLGVYDKQTLGALYLQQNENEKALHILNQALELEPTHEPTLLNKMKALLSLNQRQAAMMIAERLKASKDDTIASDAAALMAIYR